MATDCAVLDPTVPCCPQILRNAQMDEIMMMMLAFMDGPK